MIHFCLAEQLKVVHDCPWTDRLKKALQESHAMPPKCMLLAVSPHTPHSLPPVIEEGAGPAAEEYRRDMDDDDRVELGEFIASTFD